jgi:hypothetical protein
MPEFGETMIGVPMKNPLLTICLFGTLIMASAAPSPAGTLLGGADDKVSQADVCQASCRANADACRTQCSDPEEEAQCIVDCDKGECKTNCNNFEAACKQRCEGAKNN